MATNTTHATSQASVSESNRSRIVKHLYHNGISSRAQIAKALELTPAAITKITARLIEAGINTVLQRNAWPTSTVEVAL